MTALADVKRHLRVTHDNDDELITRLIGSALRESLAFLNSADLPPVPGSPVDLDIPEDVFQAVVLLVQADYDADPAKRPVYRSAAEQLLMPYRTGMGV